MAVENVDPPRRKILIPTNDIAFESSLQPNKANQPYILDLTTGQRLFFQTIPLDITVNPEASWVVIAPPGMNNAFYQYTGGEDSLEFTITWYADDESRQDVIRKCKWLESLTRNDGYDNPPHVVQFIFGDLFKNSKWIVFGAAYKLSNFNREVGMLPQMASQQLVLKRVSQINRTRNEILKYDT